MVLPQSLSERQYFKNNTGSLGENNVSGLK